MDKAVFLKLSPLQVLPAGAFQTFSKLRVSMVLIFSTPAKDEELGSIRLCHHPNIQRPLSPFVKEGLIIWMDLKQF